MTPLKVAILGLGATGQGYLSAVRNDARFELVAVADTDRRMDVPAIESARFYDDYRSLVVESSNQGLDLLLVALEPHQSMEFVPMAADRKIGVYHKTPWARNVQEARRLVERFEQNECPLIISRPWAFEPAFAMLQKNQGWRDQVYAATSDVWTSDDPHGWKGDAVRAGGGALLHGAYDAVDMVISTLGTPETVFARCSKASRPAMGRSYDTEDVAIVSLGFGRERVGSIMARRRADTTGWLTVFYTDDRRIEVNGDRLSVRTNKDGAEKHCKVGQPDSVARSIEALADWWKLRDAPLCSTGRDHLNTIAVIEAAYLSAKTGEPESPMRLIG